MARSFSRRELFQKGAQISVGGALLVATVGAQAADTKVCADPKAMDGDQKSMRTSLNYVEMSPDQTKTCSICAFYAAGNDGCGTCLIFTAPANPKGHCNSWSAKS